MSYDTFVLNFEQSVKTCKNVRTVRPFRRRSYFHVRKAEFRFLKNSSRPANSVLLLQVTRNKNSSFSAVSTPIFTIKYSLESSRRDLQIPHSPRDLKFHFFSQKIRICLADFYDFHVKNRQHLK